MAEKFNNAISVFPDSIRSVLSMIPTKIKNETFEIRVRKNKPLILSGAYGVAFVGVNSVVSHIDSLNSVIISPTDIQNIASAVCDYSVYSHETDMADGFVTYGNGNRVGFCGTAVITGDKVTSVSNISSLNIRIARNFDNAADEILAKLYKDNFPKGIIIAGAPCTGKTTILKSLAYKLSSEYKYGFKKCVIVDERFEMSSTKGLNCDILSGYRKDMGIIHAIRTLSPEIIICDEIADASETEKIIKGLDSGVSFIVSIHSGSREELFKRSISKELIASGGFDYAVILGNSQMPCTVNEIIDLKEQIYENDGCNNDTCKLVTDDIFSYQKRKSAL